MFSLTVSVCAWRYCLLLLYLCVHEDIVCCCCICVCMKILFVFAVTLIQLHSSCLAFFLKRRTLVVNWKTFCKSDCNFQIFSFVSTTCTWFSLSDTTNNNDDNGLLYAYIFLIYYLYVWSTCNMIFMCCNYLCKKMRLSLL